MDIYNIRQELSRGKSIYDLPIRVTFYARVSTDKDEQANSLKNQITYYQDKITRSSNWTYVEGYIDEGVSGTSILGRNSFQKMIEEAKQDKFDMIITKEITRFSRNTVDSIKFTQELLQSGVAVHFETDNINTIYPDAELRLTIMSSIAQDEVRKISERVKFGFQRAIESGVVLGNSSIWGYKKDNGKLVIEPEEAKFVKMIFEMYAYQNIGIRTICQYLNALGYKNTKGNDFSFSTIRGIITNPKYKGYYCGRKSTKQDYRRNDLKVFSPDEWVMYKDEEGETVPAIVSEEVWEKANIILNTRREKMIGDNKTSYQNKYKYSGKIICKKHNTAYYRSLYRYKSGNREVWQCRKYSEKGLEGCNSPIIYTDEIDSIVNDCYNDIIVNRTDLVNELVSIYSKASQNSNLNNDMVNKKAEINEILARKDKLLDLSLRDKITDSEFTLRNNRFNDELSTFQTELEQIEKDKLHNDNLMVSAESLKNAITKEISFNSSLPQNVLDTLLDRIEVEGERETPKVILSVYFKVIHNVLSCSLFKERGVTSVCSTKYI
ncbi:MAG: recombinase family protein [Oscillospiraceae bacterium]